MNARQKAKKYKYELARLQAAIVEVGDDIGEAVMNGRLQRSQPYETALAILYNLEHRSRVYPDFDTYREALACAKKAIYKETNQLVNKLEILYADKNEREAFNMLYDFADKHIEPEVNEYKINVLISVIMNSKVHTDLLVGLLTTTYRIKNVLEPARTSLFNFVKNKLLHEYSEKEVNEILWGLL